MNAKYYIFGFIILLVLLLSISSTCSMIAYSSTVRPYAIFEGLNDVQRVNGSIDVFSSAVGNQKCVKTASGLSNSMGPLCLSDKQLYLLQSRGGNSIGSDSQIGM
jgi:hypothetical protein